MCVIVLVKLFFVVLLMRLSLLFLFFFGVGVVVDFCLLLVVLCLVEVVVLVERVEVFLVVVVDFFFFCLWCLKFNLYSLRCIICLMVICLMMNNSCERVMVLFLFCFLEGDCGGWLDLGGVCVGGVRRVGLFFLLF